MKVIAIGPGPGVKLGSRPNRRLTAKPVHTILSGALEIAREKTSLPVFFCIGSAADRIDSVAHPALVAFRDYLGIRDKANPFELIKWEFEVGRETAVNALQQAAHDSAQILSRSL